MVPNPSITMEADWMTEDFCTVCTGKNEPNGPFCDQHLRGKLIRMHRRCPVYLYPMRTKTGWLICQNKHIILLPDNPRQRQQVIYSLKSRKNSSKRQNYLAFRAIDSTVGERRPTLSPKLTQTEQASRTNRQLRSCGIKIDV